MRSFTLLLILLFRAASVAADEPPARSPVRELLGTATAEGFTNSQVTVEGVVTWADPDAGRYFFLQDGTGGIRVNYAEGSGPAPRDQVRVTGVLSSGPFAPVIENGSFERLGRGQMPKVMFGSGGGLLNGAFNGEWVETDGWIRTAEMVDGDTMVAVLDSGASRISFRVSNVKKTKPDTIIAAKVRVRGVASPIRSREATGQLVEVQVLVPREEEIFWGQREKISPWDQPPTPLRTAFRYHPGQTRGDRLKVRGKLVYVSGDTAWLHDGDAGLALRGSGVSKLKRGDRVEAVGFRDLQDFLPVLSDVIVRPDQGAEIKLRPKELPAGELQNGLHHADYVAVSGTLLDRIETPAGSERRQLVLALQSPRGMFTAELDTFGSAPPAEAWETGSLLQVTGLCAVQTDPSGDPAGFKLIVPDAASISVLKAAPFFTVRRMLILLSLTLGVLLAVAIIAFLLARRNTRLRTEVRERQAIASERGRLARDLHDTLEQGLTGLQLQIRGIGLSLKDAPSEMRTRLETMKNLVKQCRTEVRQSIWDLRAESLDDFDLGDALQRMAQSLFLGSGTRVEFRQHRDGRKIPGLIGDNLLRIGQEAMTNILKHAQAGVIEIELATTANSVSLSVSDDGRGLAGRTPGETRTGHFGLVGMEERAARLGATLDIENRPGGGTTVKVEVPLQPETETPAPETHETQSHLQDPGRG
jgi:signal transduction histidine kinase